MSNSIEGKSTHVLTLRLGLGKSFVGMGHLGGCHYGGLQTPGGIKKPKDMGKRGFFSSRAHISPVGDTSDLAPITLVFFGEAARGQPLRRENKNRPPTADGTTTGSLVRGVSGRRWVQRIPNTPASGQFI